MSEDMKASEIKKGALVWYHPIIANRKAEAAVIESEVFYIGSTECCFIDIRNCAVSIDNLEPRNS